MGHPQNPSPPNTTIFFGSLVADRATEARPGARRGAGDARRAAREPAGRIAPECKAKAGAHERARATITENLEGIIWKSLEPFAALRFGDGRKVWSCKVQTCVATDRRVAPVRFQNGSNRRQVGGGAVPACTYKMMPVWRPVKPQGYLGPGILDADPTESPSLSPHSRPRPRRQRATPPSPQKTTKRLLGFTAR